MQRKISRQKRPTQPKRCVATNSHTGSIFPTSPRSSKSGSCHTHSSHTIEGIEGKERFLSHSHIMSIREANKNSKHQSTLKKGATVVPVNPARRKKNGMTKRFPYPGDGSRGGPLPPFK